MLTIPDVIQPVPALLLTRTRADLSWHVAANGYVWPFSQMWMEAHIIFWHLDDKTSGRVAVFNYN